MSNQLAFMSRVQPAAEIATVEDHPAFCRWQPSEDSRLYASIEAWLAARETAGQLARQERETGRQITKMKRQLAFAHDFDEKRQIEAELAEARALLGELVQQETQAQASEIEAETAVSTIDAELGAYAYQVDQLSQAAGSIVYEDGSATVEASTLQDFLTTRSDFVNQAIGRPLLPQPA